MAAGLVTHNITTSAGVTFQVVSWVPNTGAPDTGAVPVAMLTDGTLTAAIGTGPKANALRVEYANDGTPITVLQGAANGGVWQIEGKTGGTGLAVPVSGAVNATQSGVWTVQPGNTANTTAWLVNNVAPWDKGSGTGGSATQRMIVDSSQLGALVAGGVPVVSGGFEYETVPISATDQVMGATGAVGDYLESLLCVVATAATSQVQIKDGNGSAITVLPNAVGGGVGTYPIPIGLTCINSTTPGWKISTAAGVTVVATGNFT